MLPFERECGGPRHDTNILDLGKSVDDFFSDAVCEELIFWIGAHIGERQHDNGLMPSLGGYRREGSGVPSSERFFRIRVPLQPLQVGADVRGMLVAQVAIFLQTLGDNPFQFGWEIGIQSDWRNGCSVQNAIEDYPCTLTTEGQCPSCHFVENGTEREQIRA